MSRVTELADTLESYFRSGNNVPVTSASIPVALATDIVLALRSCERTLNLVEDELMQLRHRMEGLEV